MADDNIITIGDLSYDVQFVREDMVRVRIRRDGEFRPEENEMVVVSPMPSIDANRSETDEEISIFTGSMILVVDKNVGAFRIMDAEKNTVLQSLSAPEWFSATRFPRMKWRDDDVVCMDQRPSDECVTSANKVSITMLRFPLSLNDGERIFGFGMSGWARPLEMRGEMVSTWTDWGDDYRTPYYWSSNGYSVFVRTSRTAKIDVGKTQGDRLVFDIENEDELEYFVQLGNARACIEGYTWLTGRSPKMPDWAFGNWMGGYWKTREDLLETARQFRQNQIPMDVLRQDSIWLKGHECDYKWDDNFPDPKGMLEELANMNCRLHVWISHTVNHDCSNFADGLKKGVFLKNRDGSVPLIKWWKDQRGATIDCTSDKACEWWKDQLRPLLKEGIAGFKVDGGNDHYFVNDDRVFADGRSIDEARNLYALHCFRCVAEVQEEIHGEYRPIWIRSGTAGAQRYPVMWAGDQEPAWESILLQMRAGISAGLCGVSFWSCDGGGFMGGATQNEEMTLRGTQFAFWNPVCQPFGIDREPWHYSERSCEIFRSFAEMRNRLNYYLVRLGDESIRSGLPMMRGMMIEFPDDPECLDIDDQYMLGSAFLVAPIYEDKVERKLYLPEGEWVEIHTNKVYDGGQWITVNADIHTIPVFVRSGVILPIKPLTQFIEDNDTSTLTLYRWQGSRTPAHYIDYATGCPIEELPIDSSDENIVKVFRKREERDVELKPLNSPLCEML